MLKLETKSMTTAIATAKTVRPRVRCTGERTYAVTGRRGDIYTVTFKVVNGMKLGSCTCPAHGYCYHLAAAASLNIALHSNYSRPTETVAPVAVSHPNANILVKPQPKEFRVEGWLI
jgi:uncharacterized Zn finger protein